jgi:hypothetical protein
MSDFSFYMDEDDGSKRLIYKPDFERAVSKLLEDLHNLEEWGEDDPAVLLQFDTSPAYARLVFKDASAQFQEYITLEDDPKTRRRMWENLMHTTGNMRAINSGHVDELPFPSEP